MKNKFGFPLFFPVLVVSCFLAIDAIGKTQIVLLGTGTPNADPLRSGPSTAIVVNGEAYIVDFGPGLVRRAAAAHENGVEGLSVDKLKRAFLTHLHSDHTVGYPDLIFTPWVLDRKEPLVVYGPKGLRDMTDHILKAFQQDIHMRLFGPEPTEDKPNGYNVVVHEIEPGLIYSDSNVKVEAIAVKHGTWPEAFGFKFTTPEKIIVISGDTAPSESIIEACKPCDVLIHEVYSKQKFDGRPPDWQNYHSKYHTSAIELGEIALRANPGLLILHHQLFWKATEEELLAEIRVKFSGKVISGKDLDVF